MIIEICRMYNSEEPTLGTASLIHNQEILFQFVTLELPYRENSIRESCIPEGEYKAFKHDSPRFGQTFWLQNVANRSEILIHSGNFMKDTLGCILVGEDFKDIDQDGFTDITSSKKILRKLLRRTPYEVKVVIQ